ncbi:DNA gyrase inhibitor YacG [Hafnia alvei]|uniref:DNA gyrase inhibitor YacG n=1 Tax=Hafnia alvei TaxID=569 RepID=A0A377PP03_HAFAL|nr:DNA gyrase inhibitor YacG [Hafnia alvei]
MTDETMTVNCPICGKSVIWGRAKPISPFLLQALPADWTLANGPMKRNAFRAIQIFQKAMTGVKSCNALTGVGFAYAI